jgi:four helix bundle protein
VQDTKNLVVAKHAKQLAIEVYRLTASYPPSERFGLTAQMRLAAVSVGSNIAEGCGRRSNKELLAYLYISNGSISELEFQLEMASDLGFGDPRDAAAVVAQTVTVRRMLNRLITFLRTQPAWRKNEGPRAGETLP